ncbi:hypothetical protein JT358_03660 [Micrococcales bacterium 31B]|nr:hypothetical protein [Micrococcales bacterium 31B]
MITTRGILRSLATAAVCLAATAAPWSGAAAMPAGAMPSAVQVASDWVEPEHSDARIAEHNDALAKGYVHKWVDPETFPPRREALPLVTPLNRFHGHGDAAAVSLVNGLPATLNYLYLTGDEAPFEALARRCTSCLAITEPLTRGIAADAYTVADPITFSDTHTVTTFAKDKHFEGLMVVVSTVHWPTRDRFVPSQSLHVQSPEATQKWLFIVANASDADTVILLHMEPYQP